MSSQKNAQNCYITLSVCGLDRIEGLWNQVQFNPLDFKSPKDGRSAYLVFILGNRVTLHAVYWGAPASSVALCDVLGGEQEEDNLFRWKLGRLGTWVLLLCVKRVIKIVALRWASCPALGWVKMQQWLSVVLKDHLLGAEHDVKSSCQSQWCNSPHPTHSWWEWYLGDTRKADHLTCKSRHLALPLLLLPKQP